MQGQVSETPPDSLVCIGTVPPKAELKGFGRVVLVEPDPDRADELQSRYDTAESVTVIAAAIGTQPGQADLQGFNFPGLRSLHAPAPALKDLFPGLKTRYRKPVQILTAAQLLERVDDLPEPVTLSIDLPGSELDILESWHAAGALDRLSQVRLRCSAEPAFEGSVDQAALTAWMRARHFTVQAVEESDPDWPLLSFEIDPAGRALSALQQELAEVRATAEAQMARVAELEGQEAKQAEALVARQARIAELDAQRAEQAEALAARIATLEAEKAEQSETLGARIAELEVQQAEQARALEARQARIAALETQQAEQAQTLEAREARIAVLEGQEAAQAQTLEARQAQIAELNGQKAEQAQTLETRQARIAALEAQQAAQAQTLEAQQARIAELEAQHVQQTKALEASWAETETAKSDLSVALRMQALAQSDLQDLQARFLASEQARATQEALLQKLTPRLQQAAHELQHLSLEQAARADAALAEEAAAKTAKTTTKSAPRKTTKRSSKTASRTTTRKTQSRKTSE